MDRIKDNKKIEKIKIIDCHTHIVPSVDDGARNLEESMTLVNMLKDQKVTTIFATPHLVIDETLMAKQKKIKEQIDKLKEKIKGKSIDLVLGYEIMGSERLINVGDFSNYTMGTSKVIMVEADPMASMSWMEELIYELKLQSLQLMIAHAERYLYFKEQPQVLKSFKKQGVYVQVNTGSISGNNGKAIMKWTKKLIKNNLVDVIGSDCHQKNWRKPEINNAIISLKKWCDKEQFDNVTYNNAKKILL